MNQERIREKQRLADLGQAIVQQQVDVLRHVQLQGYVASSAQRERLDALTAVYDSARADFMKLEADLSLPPVFVKPIR